MSSQEKSLDLDDVATLIRVLARVDRGQSLRSVATDLGVHTSTLTRLIERVNESLGSKLVAKGDRGAGETQLTVAGRKLLERFSDQLRMLAGKEQLRIASSLTLITTQVLSPVLAGVLERHKDALDYDLRLRTEIRWPEIVSDLLNGTLDMAIVWGASQRLQKKNTGVHIQFLGDSRGQFDLVFVSHDQNLIREIDRAIPETHPSDLSNENLRPVCEVLRTRRTVLLAEESQPGFHLFPRDSTVTVDTFDAAIALVRGKLADVALVPAMYADLERRASLGELYHSRAVGRLPVIVVTRQPGPSHLPPAANDLVMALEAKLRSLPERVDKRIDPTNRLCQDPSFYESMRFGYYIDGDRRNGRSCVPPYQWKWETVCMEVSKYTRQDTGNGEPLRLTGRITNKSNEKENVFTLTAERASDIFVVHAVLDSPNDETASTSTTEFVSIFTWSAKAKPASDGSGPGHPNILVGVWTGTSDLTNLGVYRAVLSSRPLLFSELNEIVRASGCQFIAAAEPAEGFDEHVYQYPYPSRDRTA